jgi:hypothetical protein
MRTLRAVFEPMADACRTRLGFSPSDIPSIVLAAHAILQTRALPEITRLVAAARDGDQAALNELGATGRTWFTFSAQELAMHSGLSAGEVLAMLEALSCRFGCQPGFRRPVEENKFRRRPIIALGNDTFFFVQIWSPLHEYVPWFFALVRDYGEPTLEHQFIRSRDNAAEQLSREAFTAVFENDGLNWPHCDGLNWPHLRPIVA